MPDLWLTIRRTAWSSAFIRHQIAPSDSAVVVRQRRREKQRQREIGVVVQRSLRALHFTDDFSVDQRQHSVVIGHLLVYNSTVKLIARLPEEIPVHR